MRVGVRIRLAGRLLGGSVALLLLATGSVRADDADTQRVIQELKARMEAMDKLKTRMEAMEKQNQQLQQQLQEMKRQVGAEASEQQPEKLGAPLSDGSVDEDQVKRIISDYLKADAAKKKEADDARKKQESEAFSEVVNNTPLFGIFDNGYLLSSKNKAFTARVGLEIQEDAVWMQAPFNVEYGKGGIGPTTDGVNTRRARIDMRGSAWDNFQYMCQFEFGIAQAVPDAVTGTGANGTSGATLGNAFGVINGNQFATPQPIELWGLFTDLPIFRNIRIGNQKPLYSFEDWNSSRFQDFMERSIGWDAFVEDQDNGFIPSICMLNYTENERMCIQAGIAKNNKTLYFWNYQNGNNMGEARITFLPWYCQNGRYMCHLGLGGMYANASSDIVLFRARPTLRAGNNLQQPIVTAARLNANHEARLCPEFYMALGPVYIQAEYYGAWANQASTTTAGPTFTTPAAHKIGDYYAYSYYVQSFIYLTGENYLYNRQLGRLEQPNPQTNFFWTRGCGRNIFGSGLWLTGVRYDWIDLRDQGVNGAPVNAMGAQASSAGVWDWTYSLKWIMNPNTQIMFNAMLESRNAATTPQSNGYIRGLGMRFQLQF